MFQIFQISVKNEKIKVMSSVSEEHVRIDDLYNEKKNAYII